jgi:hypothetical protein
VRRQNGAVTVETSYDRKGVPVLSSVPAKVNWGKQRKVKKTRRSRRKSAQGGREQEDEKYTREQRTTERTKRRE